MEVQQPAPAHQLSHHGRGGELFGIMLANLLLKVITLGVYHFWGKTRVRRYLWSQTAFAGERLAYVGRGRELLIGYALAMAALGVVLLTWEAIAAWLLAAPVAVALTAPVGYVGAILLVGVARFSARRYLLSRTRWRGIRFALSGSAWRHGLLTVRYGAVATVTLGLGWPYLRNGLAGHVIDHTWFGDLKFAYTGRGTPLLRRFLLPWLLSATLVLMLAGIVLATVATGGHTRAATTGGSFLVALIPVAIVAAVIVLVPLWMGYQAAEYRHIAAHTRLGPLRFSADIPLGRYLRLVTGNMLLLGATLGLGYAWVLVRTARFLCDHVRIDGELDFSTVGQSRQRPPGFGEGLAEAFDLGGV